MSSTKHTPGTWEVWQSPSGKWAVKAVYEDDQGNRHTTWPAVCNATGEDNEANARLIAAAPKLQEENARLKAEVERLREALEEIANLSERPYDKFPSDWRDQIAACPECQRYKDHPIQRGICDDHRKPLYDRDDHYKSEESVLGYRAKSIAREALAARCIREGGKVDVL